MKKTIAIILAALMMTTVFAACNQTQEEAPPTGTPPADTSPSEPSPGGSTSGDSSSGGAASGGAEPIVITMPTYRSGEDIGAIYFLPAVERFNALYEGKYQVVIEESPSSTHNDKLKALAQSGKLPPIFQFSDFTYARDNWFNDDFLYDLSGWLNANPAVKDVFVPAGIDYVTLPGGGIYAIPLAIVRPTGTYVNNNVFTPSKPLRDLSWDDAGAEMKAANTTWGFQTLEGAWTVNLTVVAIMANQSGGMDILNNGLVDKITDFNTPQWINTFTVLKKLFDDAGWKGGIGAAYPDTENAFVNNQVGVMPNGQWIIAVFDPEGEGAANWGPGFDGTKVTGDIFPGNVAIANPCVYDWYVSGQCSDAELEAALAFLAFISSPAELELMMLAEGGSAPMITYSQDFLSEMAKSKLMSDFAGAVNANTKYVPYLHEILPGTIMDGAGAFTANLPLLFDGSQTPEQFCAALTIAANE